MFKYFPKNNYKIDDFNYLYGVDIVERVKINEYLRNLNAFSARDYEVGEGESPENVAFALYGNPAYAYILLLSNNILSLYDEWPLDKKTFENYIVSKYGSVAAANSEIAFYFIEDGIISNEDDYAVSTNTAKYTETNYEYEKRLNDEKRQIKIINPSLIKKIEVGIQEILNGS